jgi:predicted esterase
MSEEHHIAVTKTARFFTLGTIGPEITDVWFTCHGYGQLASDFVKQFWCIEAPGRLIVVPEALSRFYLAQGIGFHAADARIGATWMTREDRETEITDYVNYLDTLYGEIFSKIDREKVRVTVLGFSQGGATANRWVTRGHARVDRLIMWGSLLASDADLNEAAEYFRKVKLTIVYGIRDQFADSATIANYEALLKEKAVPYNLVTFDGSHRMDRDVLKQLAGESA